MKYLFLIFTMLAAPYIYGQCSEFDNLIRKGDNYLKGNNPNYQEAINAYAAAILACSDRAGEARQQIAKMVNDINALKDQAVKAGRRANAERKKAEKALADLRLKNLSIFESFAGLGKNQIYTLDFAEALEKMKVAVEIDVDAELKKQQLTEPIAELRYFFAEGGRRPELAWIAARLLLKLEPEDELAQALRDCLREIWGSRARFAPLLEKLPFFPKFRTRYYPEMVSVPLGENGVFEMGSLASEWGHQSDEQPHRVKLSSYRMAVTPSLFTSLPSSARPSTGAWPVALPIGAALATTPW